MTVTLTALQKQRRDTASNWTSNNTVLLAGEWGIESDTKRFKIGDGATAWQSLDYVPIPDTNRLLAGNLTVGGDFTVNGTTTTIDTTNLVVEDKNIEIGKVSTPTDTTADGGGLTLRGATDKTFNWVDATDSWTSSEHLNLLSSKVLKIAGTEILSASALGSSVLSSSLTSLGTISSGVWQGTPIGSAYMVAGTTSVAGALQLTDSVTSTSTTTAATPNSVKTAKDAADSAQTTANAALPKAGGQISGNITCAGTETFDGRDLSVDGAKLDGIEASADVTDATNVNAAGAIMESDIDAKGDLLAGTADNTVARLPVGVNGYVLKADSSTATGLVWAVDAGGIDGSSLNASNLDSGTIPDARFPATLPAISGANLTNLPSGTDSTKLPLTGGTLTGDLLLDNQKDLRFVEADANGSNYVAFQAPASIGSDIIWTLPATDAAVSGYALVSDAAGNLSWAQAGGGAKGGGGEAIFHESENTMDNDYTISSNHNAVVPSPLTINATLTINSPSVVHFV